MQQKDTFLLFMLMNEPSSRTAVTSVTMSLHSAADLVSLCWILYTVIQSVLQCEHVSGIYCDVGILNHSMY